MNHDLLVALMGDGYDRTMFGGSVYCGKKRPPPKGRAVGTPAQCFSKGVGVGLNIQKQKKEAPPTREELEKMTLRKLGDLAREKRIPKYGIMKKAELIDALLVVRGGMESPQMDGPAQFGVAVPQGAMRPVGMKAVKGLPQVFQSGPLGAMIPQAAAPIAQHAQAAPKPSLKRKAEEAPVAQPAAKKGGKRGAGTFDVIMRQLGNIARGEPIQGPTQEEMQQAYTDAYTGILSRAKPTGEVAPARKTALEQVADQAGTAADIADKIPGLGTASKVLQGVDFANQLAQGTRDVLRNTAEQYAPGASNSAALQSTFGFLGFGKPKTVVMSRKDYEREHKHLISLLNHLAGVASKEAAKQAAEPQLKGGMNAPQNTPESAATLTLPRPTPASTARSTPSTGRSAASMTSNLSTARAINPAVGQPLVFSNTVPLPALPPPVPVAMPPQTGLVPLPVFFGTPPPATGGRKHGKRCVNNIDGGCGKCGGTRGSIKRMDGRR
jgi:hypothetical protein